MSNAKGREGKVDKKEAKAGEGTYERDEGKVR